MNTQLVLGDFIFSLSDKTPYGNLTRRSSGGWVANEIMGGKPQSYNTGLGLQTINLSGKLFGHDGMRSLDRLRKIQATQLPQLLVDGYGNNLGQWKIMEIMERQSRVISDGQAMVVNFDVALEEFDGGRQVETRG